MDPVTKLINFIYFIKIIITSKAFIITSIILLIIGLLLYIDFLKYKIEKMSKRRK